MEIRERTIEEIKKMDSGMVNIRMIRKVEGAMLPDNHRTIFVI